MFSERLRILRNETHLTQAQVAQEIGLSARGYQDLELGANPRGDTLLSIANFYKVSIDWLMGRTDMREVNGWKGLPGPAHQIIFEAEVEVPETLEPLLNKVITAALEADQVDVPCEISVLITDDAGIHQINLEQRQVDRPTDVLSFPMFNLTPGDKPGREDAEPETGLVPLGDMVISLERARAQAQEFGHSLEREVCYLAVHSVLHLLGYDHMDEGPMKAQMRAREEAILGDLGITREAEL